MSKDVVIVESPTKARTISKILGNSYSVLSSMGHIRDLPQKKLGVDVENGFTPNYEINQGRKKTLKLLTDSIKNSKSAYLATDPDREGEAISWHLYEILKEKNSSTEFHRVTFHEITRDAVLNAFSNATEINMNLVNAQQARRVLDRIVGYRVSPLLWKQVNRKAKSAGRVQSVALRLICEREKEIVNFVPKEYWNFKASFSKKNSAETFLAKLTKIDGKKADVNNSESALEIYEEVIKAPFSVEKVEKTHKNKRPSPPFITSTLQQAASTNLRFSTKQTMMIAQQLYEGIDSGQGPAGLITYMRTDSVNISKEAQKNAKEYIQSVYGDAYIPQKPHSFKSKKLAQEAHEAIRPTDLSLPPQKAEAYLDKNQHRLYRMIWNRFIASQMAPAKNLHHTVDVSSDTGTCKRKYLFRATSVTTIFPGYLKVYSLHDVETDSQEESETAIPELKNGENCKLNQLEKEQKFTEPPPRFSEGALVRELENNGVGRPSTYASIVATIQMREYVQKTKGKLIPTELGMTVTDFLVAKLPNLFEVHFTARMEDELDTIEQGSINWIMMLDSFYKNFSEWLSDIEGTVSTKIEEAIEVISIFPENITWLEAKKSGNRQYDDKKFVESLKTQLEKNKNLTDKQWNALMIIIARYEDQLKNLSEMLEKFNLLSHFQRVKNDLIEKNNRLQNCEVDQSIIEICKSLESVKTWEKNVGKGNRVFDDKKFYLSLARQAESGKILSEAQTRALRKLAIKYKDQIDNFDHLKNKYELVDENPVDDGSAEETKKLFTLTEKINNWKSDNKNGRVKFDPKQFVDSLANQFETKKHLSKRQLYSLRKVIKNHKDQISDFEQHALELDLDL